MIFVLLTFMSLCLVPVTTIYKRKEGKINFDLLIQRVLVYHGNEA